MKNYRQYLYITLGFCLLFTIVSTYTIKQLVKNNTISLLDSTIALGKNQADQIAILTGNVLKTESNKSHIQDAIQEAIVNTLENTVYISVIDWSGKLVNYPDNAQRGTKTDEEVTPIAGMDHLITGEELYNFIVQHRVDKPLALGKNIIYMRSVPNSDLITAAHINVDNIHLTMNRSTNYLLVVFLIIGLLSLLFLLAIIRYLSSKHEEQLAATSSKIEDSFLNISKLNTSLEEYQKKIMLAQEQKEVLNTQTPENTEKSKERLLTYVRNELVSVAIDDISYIYVDNTITYVIQKDGKRSTTNDSLEQIYTSLDERYFFRANRQIIVAIHAIETITKFGNSALKIQTNPASEVEIVIGKNKAAAFKQWLDL